jgi:hypothetical protein
MLVQNNNKTQTNLTTRPKPYKLLSESAQPGREAEEMKKASEVTPDLLPIKIFAARLGVSVWTARGMCYRGRVASVKIGAKLLVPTGEVERLIADNMRPRLKSVA